MSIRYKYQPDTPCSLHDMTVYRFACTEESISMHFKDTWSRELYLRKQGKITIEDVDFDEASVVLLNENGEYGDFQGKKLSLQDFLKSYTDFTFEIADDRYGYNSVEYSGYLYVKLPDENELTLETQISIYHFGDIVYDIEA